MTLSPNQTQPKANVHRATPIRRISRWVDDRGDQQVYPYSFRRTRVDQWTSCFHLSLFSTYVHGEAQGWTHFTLFISFLLCCLKLCNHLHTINCDIWLLRTTTTSFLHWLISFLLLLKISSPWSKRFCSCKHLAREVDDSGPRGRGLYIGNTASLIRASEYLQTLHVTLEYV